MWSSDNWLSYLRTWNIHIGSEFSYFLRSLRKAEYNPTAKLILLLKYCHLPKLKIDEGIPKCIQISMDQMTPEILLFSAHIHSNKLSFIFFMSQGIILYIYILNSTNYLTYKWLCWSSSFIYLLPVTIFLLSNFIVLICEAH